MPYKIMPSKRMFSKVLIANRGAIACRIIRTLKTMNISAVAVYAESDADSLHVRQADEAYSLGEGGAQQTYLNQEKILEICRQANVQAVHPGYGFLSENPGFVSACEKNGIVFIGPDSDSMEAFALKHQARALAEKFDVPLIPGTPLITDKNQAAKSAEQLGYPVMLKSTAGGGGIGMQVCQSETELLEVFDSVVRLSANNFSNSGVFLEKYIACARHIEVQVFGNGLGCAVALGERDCSLQRRNQKVIEETPAPNLSEPIRQALQSTAIRLLAGVNYRSAGTVEFIYDTAAQSFYFLEVNTRLQVEHGVTEEVFGVDLVAWMVEQAFTPIEDLQQRREKLTPEGHAIQARLYAENPGNNFQPSAGLLSHVAWPEMSETAGGDRLRIDTWVNAGVEVPAYFDPMLAKIIVHAGDRETAIKSLSNKLSQTSLYGIETNLEYLQDILSQQAFLDGQVHTGFLKEFTFNPTTFEVLVPGTMTTIQDLPGRQGYWSVGVPPSGPFDNNSFALANKILGNPSQAAGLEITLNGPTLRFNQATEVVITGADFSIFLDDQPQSMWTRIAISAGQTLKIGKAVNTGARAYLAIAGGLQCPEYLGSRSTFTLGQFGGHVGRALKTGDILHYLAYQNLPVEKASEQKINKPTMSNHWELQVIYGPHGAPDFFTDKDIQQFFETSWQVHYNSSRTGIRLIGPKPEWARDSGGEAGMHPSNIHDNAYAFGSVDFTGDMPVILGPDGPSLGGFVCPATVITADLWKLGQLKAGDRISFKAVGIETALQALQRQEDQDHVQEKHQEANGKSTIANHVLPDSCIVQRLQLDKLPVVTRLAGDRFVLIEFGEQILDLALRFRVHALEGFFRQLCRGNQQYQTAIIDLTAGIRSLQVHYDPSELSLRDLLVLIEEGCRALENQPDLNVPSRIVHLPLSWDDDACRQAVQKYMQSVRPDAPWCPDNIEFIRRINGLESVEQVKDILFQADYVVMGLGDVYLGAPVATPIDPRHRLVTTKYNPARTWTAENSVGIGGAYLCVYGMEGPGGYQFVGRTLQMWNRYQQTAEFEKPWLLRCFDRIRFYPVSHEELRQIRKQFPKGNYPLKIESGEFSLKDYQSFLEQNRQDIDRFTTKRDAAFQQELERWHRDGHFHFDSAQQDSEDAGPELDNGLVAVESSVAGSVWQLLVAEGQQVKQGDSLLVLESMKMEIDVHCPADGVVKKILKQPGSQVAAGQALVHIEEAS